MECFDERITRLLDKMLKDRGLIGSFVIRSHYERKKFNLKEFTVELIFLRPGENRILYTRKHTIGVSEGKPEELEVIYNMCYDDLLVNIMNAGIWSLINTNQD